ncbi:MAG: hypothetical protein ACK6DP_18135 [Gemmatimonas sp.]|jgi:hypothetical protein|uniref:hypothetical protein n=1 Tax=Gemmatimonas sp. TaxID=1962908 RepID=UPI00391F98DC|nr:hypothetical protein [Gemmatimonadota bacterium]
MTDHAAYRASRTRRRAFTAIVLGTLGIALAYVSAFLAPPLSRWGPWVMAVALPACMVGTMSFGATRRGRSLGVLAWPIGLVCVLVTGGFLLALLLPADLVEGPYWLGLPRRAAVILYGVGILPLFVLPVAYALTFDALTLSDDDIARVRAARLGDGPPGHR